MKFRILSMLLIPLFFLCSGKSGIDDSIEKTISDDLKSAPREISEKMKPLYDKLKKEPMNVQTYNNIGDIYFKTGKLDKARLMFSFALKIDSNYVPALFNMSVINSRKNNLKKAIEYLTKVYELEPDNFRAITNLSMYHYRMRNLHKALEFALMAYNLKQGDENLIYNVAIIYKSLGEEDLALEFYEKTIAVNPNHENAKKGLNMLLYKRESMRK